jgi:hypothetical protein
MLAIHYVDIYWLVMPQLSPVNPQFHLLDLLCFIGEGGVFLRSLRCRWERTGAFKGPPAGRIAQV